MINLRLVDNWKKVAKHSSSVRFLLIGGVFAGAEAMLPYAQDVFGLTVKQFAWITFFIIMGAFVSRFVAQKSISGDKDGE